MRPDYLKSMVLDTYTLASRLLSHADYMQHELMQPWPFPFKPTIEVFQGMLVAHAKDIVEYSLCAHIRGHHDSQLELCCQSLTGRNNPEQAQSLKRFYNEIAGMDWHERIIALVGTQTYDIWNIDATPDTVVIVHIGDFRIMEWERDHMENGEYYADPITIRNSRR